MLSAVKSNKNAVLGNTTVKSNDKGVFVYFMWAVNTLLGWFPECNKEELEKELDRYI